MKRILLTLCLALSLATVAKAQFFYGIQFGFFTDWGSETTTGQSGTASGSSFNYTIKPTVGYYFNDGDKIRVQQCGVEIYNLLKEGFERSFTGGIIEFQGERK